LNFLSQSLWGDVGQKVKILPILYHRASPSPLRPPPPLTPPPPSRGGGASTPVPLLLRHGAPAPCGSSLRSEPSRRREGTTAVRASSDGPACFTPLHSVRSSLAVRCSSIPLRSASRACFSSALSILLTPRLVVHSSPLADHPAPRIALRAMLVAVFWTHDDAQ